MGSVNMTAVYLAAGYGSRIASLTNDPKCMLKINDETLLERSFRIWENLGIKNVVLVLGYEANKLQNIANKFENKFNITYQLNEDYKKQGNTFSLYLGIKDVQETSLIFDADLVYDEVVLGDFIKTGHQSEILIGKASLDDIECAKALIDENKFVRMTVDKRAISEDELKKYQFSGEAIGILKFSAADTKKLTDHAKVFLADPKKLHLNWEHLLNEFLIENNVLENKMKNGRSIEIDTPEDYERAKNLFY